MLKQWYIMHHVNPISDKLTSKKCSIMKKIGSRMCTNTHPYTYTRIENSITQNNCQVFAIFQWNNFL